MITLQGLSYTIAPPAITTTTAAVTHLNIVAAAGVLTVLKGVRIGFAGVTAADVPALVEIIQRTGADGTGTALSSVHMKKRNSVDSRSIQATGKHTYSAEPTYNSGDITEYFHSHPQSGYFWVPMEDLVITNAVPVGIRVTTSSNSISSHVVAYLEEFDIA